MILIANWRILDNKIVRNINFGIYALATYFFLIWMALLMDSLWAPLLFMALAFTFWWKRYELNINLNRCTECHTMNVGLDKGRTYQGENSNVN